MRVLLVICLFLALAPTAAARLRPDSGAPPGADPNWLPAEEWVMQRWMPFDQASLERVVPIPLGQLYAKLKYGHRSLRALAISHGVPNRGLASKLLASRRGSVGPRTWRILRLRTNRILGQRHL